LKVVDVAPAAEGSVTSACKDYRRYVVAFAKAIECSLDLPVRFTSQRVDWGSVDHNLGETTLFGDS
jgi:hypothetical protein